MEKEKKHLRKLYSGKRDALPEKERKLLGGKISGRLFALEKFKKAEIVMFFVSFKSEVETFPMMKKALEEGKRIAVPITTLLISPRATSPQ